MTSLARDGHMVMLGFLSGAVTKGPVNLGPLLFKRIRVQGPFLFFLSPERAAKARLAGTTLRSRTLEYQSDLLQQFSAKALDKLVAKCGGEEGLDLTIHKVRSSLPSPQELSTDQLAQVYDWNNIVEAHEEMEAARNIGKIICEIIPESK